jgi:hypothetical protein
MKYNATSIQQHQAAKLLNQYYRDTGLNIMGDGLKLCRRAKAHNSANPQIAYIAVTPREGGYMAQMKDVAHCGNAHLCPFCSSTKAAHMRLWLKDVFFVALQKTGLVTGLLTLTAHHKRDHNWAEFSANYFKAQAAFSIAMRREMKTIGSIGRIRAVETPVGTNGLHIHTHDLFTYRLGASIEAFQAIALTKWKSALRKFGMSCNKHGVDIKEHGSFDPYYIAKEIAAHDTKECSKSDLVSLFKLLDKSARGDKHAGRDWIRAALALQGRDRFNVGMLAKNLCVESPSDWKRPEGVAKTDPVATIEYPQAQHLMATSNDSNRAGLALILHSARQEPNGAGKTQKMVNALCMEYTKQKLLEAPLKAAAAYARAQENNANLVALGAIAFDTQDRTDALALDEIKHQQAQRIANINAKLAHALAPVIPYTRGLELDFS